MTERSDLLHEIRRDVDCAVSLLNRAQDQALQLFERYGDDTAEDQALALDDVLSTLDDMQEWARERWERAYGNLPMPPSTAARFDGAAFEPCPTPGEELPSGDGFFARPGAAPASWSPQDMHLLTEAAPRA